MRIKKICLMMMSLVILSGFSAFSQTVSLPFITANPNEQVSVPITVTNFTNIGSIMLTVQVNPTILAFTGISGGPSGMVAGVSGNNVILSWNGPPYYTNVNGVLVNLVFNYNGPGSSPLTFLPAGCEIIKMPGFVPVTAAFTNGQVSPFSGNATQAVLMNQECVVTGNAVSMALKFEGFLSNIGSIIQKIDYDESKMVFTSVTGTGTLAGATAGINSGIITISWINSSGTGINYPDNQILLNFNYIGISGTTLEFFPGCIIKTSTSVNIPVTYFNGSITLNPIPTPVINLGGPTTICNGDTLVLATSQGTGYTYLWSNAATTQAIAVTTSGTYSVTVSNGTCNATSTPTSVTVNPLPTPAITGLANVCAGISGVTYTTQPGMTDYLWDISPGGLITSGNGSNIAIVTWNTSGLQWISVNYTNQNGCAALLPATFPVLVSPAFIPGTIASNQTISYNTQPALLTGLAPTGGNVPYTYQWQSSPDSINFTDITAATNLNYAPGNLIASTWYRQIQTSADNCGSGFTNTVAITVLPLPYIIITSPNGGESWMQSSTHTITWDDNLTENVSIALHKGSIFHQQITASTPSIGTFTWTITDDQIPGSDYLVKITSIEDYEVYDFSDSAFSISNFVPSNLVIQDITLSSGQVNCFNATQTINIAGNGTTFLVQSGGSATMIAGSNIKYFPSTAVQSGGYLWGYIAPAGPWCQTPALPAVIASDGSKPGNMAHTAFKVYPNPTTGTFIIEINGHGLSDKTTAEIVGIWGEVLLRKVFTSAEKAEFSLINEPNGLYVIRLFYNDKAETIKIIKK